MSVVTPDIGEVENRSQQASAVSFVTIPRVLLIAALVPLAVMKLLYVFAMPVLPDEGYYWVWGQFPALSYFDHPPLLAWFQGAVHGVFGATIFSLRLVPLVAFGAMVWIAWFWCKRLAPADKHVEALLITLIIWLSSPLILRYTSLAIQDCLLIVFTMAAVHFTSLFLIKRDAGEDDWSLFFAACVCVGLAGLSKYNAVFVALGFALFFLLTVDGRSMLGRWQVWAGLAVIGVMQTPVLIWNMAHGWPSLQFHLSDRIGETFGEPQFLGNIHAFVVGHIQMLGPGMVLLMVRFAFMPGRARSLARSGVFVMAASTLCFAMLTFSNTILIYWNMVAFAAVMPAVAFLLRFRVELLVHVGYGLTVGVWYLLLFGLYPVNPVIGAPTRAIDIQFGMREIADRMAHLEARFQPDVLMTSDYRTAGMLGFTMNRSDIMKIGPRDDQFDFWLDASAMKGKSALVLVDDAIPETMMVTDRFETVETVHSFTINRFGHDIHSWRVVYAQNHCGCGPN